MTLEIYVKFQTGKTIVLELEGSNSILDVKQRVRDREAAPPPLQELIFAGKSLEDDLTLTEYNIQKGSILDLVMQSGVVSYDLVYASIPPLGATNLACLGAGAVMSQSVTGIAAGDYLLGFYAQGDLAFSVEFFGAGDVSLGVVSGTASSIELAPFSLPCGAPSGTTSATVRFTAGPAVVVAGFWAVLLDLASFARA